MLSWPVRRTRPEVSIWKDSNLLYIPALGKPFPKSSISFRSQQWSHQAQGDNSQKPPHLWFEQGLLSGHDGKETAITRILIFIYLLSPCCPQRSCGQTKLVCSRTITLSGCCCRIKKSGLPTQGGIIRGLRAVEMQPLIQPVNTYCIPSREATDYQ